MASYNASDIQEKSDADHVRHRTRMYLGEDARNTAAREIADNAIDEVLGGHAKHVTIRIHDDNSVEVYDSGRGVPPDYDANGKSGILKSLGSLNSGGKFDTDAYGGANTGGMNGVGGSGANFISSRFDVRVYRDGREHYLAFREGLPGHYEGDVFDPDAEFTEGDNVIVSDDVRPDSERALYPSGTRIRFMFDDTLALDAEFDAGRFMERVKYYPYLVPECVLHAHTPESSETVDGSTLGGIQGLLNDHLISPETRLAETDLTFSGTTTFKRMIPGKKRGQKKQEEMVPVKFDVAIGWDTKSYDMQALTFGNTILTPDNGVHLDALMSAFESVVGAKASALKLLRRGEPQPSDRDIMEGARVVVRVQLNDPPFEGQDKHVLKGAALKNALTEAYMSALRRYFNNKDNADFVEQIVNRAINASRIRTMQNDRLASKRAANATKTQGMFMTMPEKFQACSQMGPGEGAELYICEGDSAASTIVAARDSKYQAVYGVRGKTKNAFKVASAKLMESEEIADIVRILGAGIGHPIEGKEGLGFQVDDCQFDRVVITTDADFDGAHITTLLLTLFYSHMPGLIESGRVFIAIPPLFSIFPSKGETLYAVTEQERDRIIEGLSKKKLSFKVSRNKGLGEMPADEFWHTVLNPETRSIKQVTMGDAELAQDFMEMLFRNQRGDMERKKQWVLDRIAEMEMSAMLE